MVARHEMPGKQAETVRPVGNGVIRGARPYPSSKTLERPFQPDHTVPFLRRHPGYGGQAGTGFSVPRFQAFHAWLPSCGPYGTVHLHLYREPIVRLRGALLQYSNNPLLSYSITPLDRIRARGRARARARA
jgi:hypothetical protein